MPGKKRFLTLSKKNHLLGRLSVSFRLNKATKELSVHLNTTRDLITRLDDPSKLLHHIHFRVQLLPHDDTAEVADSLFRVRDYTKQRPYKRFSRSHLSDSGSLTINEVRMIKTCSFVSED